MLPSLDPTCSRQEPLAGSVPTSGSCGIPRRDFLSLCTAVAAVLGLGPGGVRKVQAALAAGLRQPVLWLHFAECTGCTEALLRSTNPYFDDLILNTIALDYHETVMVEAGEGAEALRNQVIAKYSGDFLCVVEGSIPTAANGMYGTIGTKTMYEIAAEVLPKAKGIITIGSCSSDGGVAAASPNPAGVRSVTGAFPGLKVPVIKCPGCPPNPVNFVAIIANYLLKGTTPALDSSGRPTFAYGKTVHQQCGFLGTAKCLQSQGCRGISTFHNCPQLKYNDGTSFCQQAGHVCIGCSEAGFWDGGTLGSQPFWKNYGVKVDTNKAGISYTGDPNGIVSTNVRPADGGAGGASGNTDAGRGGAGGTAGSGGTSGGGGSTGAGGSSASGGATSNGGIFGSGGSAANGGATGTGGLFGGGGSSPLDTSGTGTASAKSLGCECNTGAGRAGSAGLGIVGTIAALGAVTRRILRPPVRPSQHEGDADTCPASSSIPSPESKDT